MSPMHEHDSETGPRSDGRLLLDPRAQLGYLYDEWKRMFRRETIGADVMAAIAVALVAVPLSLAIANASGVKPEVGLVTAVVGGIVVAAFGGCRLQVSGPAAAMTFLVYEIITKYGFEGMIAATFLAGLLQIATGVFRLGRIMQFIPRPVVAGFLSGIGLTILCTQLPKVLGYDVAHDEEGGALAMFVNTLRQIGKTDLRSVAVGLTAMVAMFGVPRISRKLPAPLIAVLAATLLPWLAGWTAPNTGIRLLGELPRAFPVPRLPVIPWYEFNELIMAAVTIYLLASIESLLSAAVVDSMSRTTRVDNDQELVGQGLANLASSLFRGIPVTGVIARSGTNIMAGARTRLSAILHALMILVMMFLLAGPVGQIPIAALAGVLLAVALRMVEVRLLRVLWRGNRAEAAVFLVTTGTILLTDLIVGVPVGMVAAFLYVVYEMSSLRIEPIELPGPHAHGGINGDGTSPIRLVEVEGPLFFASAFHLRSVVQRIGRETRVVIFDLERVPFLDATGAELLEEAIDLLARRQVAVVLTHPTPAVRQRLATLAGSYFKGLRACPIFDDRDAAVRHAEQLLEAPPPAPPREPAAASPAPAGAPPARPPPRRAAPPAHAAPRWSRCSQGRRGGGSMAERGRFAGWLPGALAVGAVAVVLSPLLFGIEPVGGDPDRIFRPIKQELADALRAGHLPLWSDRLGLGLPLLAESHAATLYPPNHLLYRWLDVPLAYRLSMWLHMVATAAATFAYARVLGITPWGAALSAVAFSLCGFEAIHSSHEWAYHTLAYVPLILLCAEGYLASGRLAWLAALALASGAAWLVGHFQVQTWTAALVAVTALWRTLENPRHGLRATGVLVALMWGAAIAAAQLGPSWELARFVGQEDRDRSSYAYPPSHWAEPALPRLYREIDPEDAHWWGLSTSGYEACLYVGTVPLVLAFVGLLARRRGMLLWKLLVPATLALATMPHWWPRGYELVLMTPGVGLFRCPARWTVFTSLGLALLAGSGLDRALGGRRFAIGVGLAVAYGLAALAWAAWTETPGLAGVDGAPRAVALFDAALGERFRGPLLVWGLSLVALGLWRRGIVPAALIVVLAVVELGWLYYHMTTTWDRPARLPADSLVLTRLAGEPEVGMVGGELDNLPLRAGLATATPYVGFKLPRLDALLSYQTEGLEQMAGSERVARWLRARGVTHIVRRYWGRIEGRGYPRLDRVWEGHDPVLVALAHSGNSRLDPVWSILRLPGTPRPARLATRFRVFGNQRAVLEALVTGALDDAEAALMPGDEPRFVAPEARSARIVRWDGRAGVIEHDGACALVLSRTSYPGWRYRVDGGAWRPVGRVDGGLQALWIDGAGTSRVERRFEPSGWPILAGCSAVAAGAAIVAGAAALPWVRWRRARAPAAP
jgi:high affinity sulfate transporter 1